MIKYEQRRGLLARDWHGFEAAAAPLLNTLGLHFATDGYTPVRRGKSKDFLAWGYFQSEKYFADFANVIKTELRAKRPRRGRMRTSCAPPSGRSAYTCGAAITKSLRTPSCRSAPRRTMPAPSPPSRQRTPMPRSLSFRTMLTGRRQT